MLARAGQVGEVPSPPSPAPPRLTGVSCVTSAAGAPWHPCARRGIFT